MASQTVIQGYEPSPQNNSGANSMYSRGAVDTHVQQPVQPSATPVQRPAAQATGKPVVGFAYTVSRSMTGEYWPLHIIAVR